MKRNFSDVANFKQKCEKVCGENVEKKQRTYKELKTSVYRKFSEQD